VHATPSDPLYRYLGPDPELWAKEVAGVDADVVVVGHTHLQFELELAGKRVVNPGSVGQPKDGDPRAAFAVLDDGRERLCRATYPVELTIDSLRSAGISAAALAALGSILRTGAVRPG
jgi:diadenosine tetraphosphatase ApaH/serine/threonine PP2A family protein phosphatase